MRTVSEEATAFQQLHIRLTAVETAAQRAADGGPSGVVKRLKLTEQLSSVGGAANVGRHDQLGVFRRMQRHPHLWRYYEEHANKSIRCRENLHVPQEFRPGDRGRRRSRGPEEGWRVDGTNNSSTSWRRKRGFQTAKNLTENKGCSGAGAWGQPSAI